MNKTNPSVVSRSRVAGRLIGGLALTVILALPALADSIAPSSFSASIATGGSVTIHKTLTVTAGSPTSAKVDIFLIADTTGSMYGSIGAVQVAANSLLSSLSGLGDVQFGIASYKDQGDAYWALPFSMDTNLTSNLATAQTAINTWSANGGGDTPESYNNALLQVANTGTWRTGSQRFAVWFGDAPSHPESGGSWDGGVDLITTPQAISAMNAKGVHGEAIDVGYGGLNSAGQATQIASATGGQYFNGINTSTIVSTIMSAITTSFASYSTVGIDTSELPAGLTASVVPGSYTGSFDRSIDRTFGFDVKLTGTAPGTYDFNLYGTLDGGRVATEADRIVVGGGSVPDAASTCALLVLGLGCLAALRRKR